MNSFIYSYIKQAHIYVYCMSNTFTSVLGVCIWDHLFCRNGINTHALIEAQFICKSDRSHDTFGV